ncbi:MAG: roadblock/LC7 domain-containing protein [Verrucomicrobiota bacterium]|nr:roadblock/LC7 domain-containing protein [Verrucomicrobiota bacterium]
MTIPFLNLFKKAKAQLGAGKERSTATVVVAPLEKPVSERFSKTVMPNATRTMTPQDPFQMASRSSGAMMATATAVAPAPSGSRTIAFSAQAAASTRPRDLPPAVALALEPRVERVISLELADVVAGIPEGYVKPMSDADASRRVLLKASEVERGMASGKPAISLATIYQQVPEIFLRNVTPADTTQVVLPFQKVLDQFSSLQVRRDQERQRAVPQVETPFLKVTLEDNSTFGTTMEPLETGDFPPVRVELPTAQAFAAAEPEPATNGANHFVPSNKAQSTPSRIPFKLTPNGTDVPAPESVPASSGPSVPTSFPAPATPTRIPFKMTAPSEEVRPKPEPWLTAETLKSEAEAAAPISPIVPFPGVTEMKVSLTLKPILQALPTFQLNGDLASVPAEARVQLPFALIEPQLSSGRIAVTPKVFEAALPEEYRSLFKADEAGDVMLSLQEVLKNLPTTSLRMRDDQEEQEKGENFATPFSAKAEEDAKRLNVTGTPVAKPAEVVAPEPAPVIPAAIEAVESPEKNNGAADTVAATRETDRAPRTPLQVALETDDKLDAKSVVAHINEIPGVKACAIMFGDGLSLAGALPAEYETEGLCAMAPSLMQRIENHMVETKLGALRGMTLTCLKGAVTFFMHENLCLAALHSGGDLTTEVREKLSRVVHELSRKYSHPV